MYREENMEDNEDLMWEEISTEHLIQDEWIDFRRSAYRFPDGSVYEPYYSYSRRDYVVIVASDEDGKYLCVRQYRQGIGEVTTEFVAGGIERKDGKEYAGSGRADAGSGAEIAASGQDSRMNASNADLAAEDGLEAAKRELREETGYESDEWQHLLTVPSNATIADNYAYLYVARNCRKVSEQDLDAMEFINVRKYSADEIDRMVTTGQFKQAIHCLAWLLSIRR